MIKDPKLFEDLRSNIFEEMRDVISSFDDGYQIQARPYKKCIVVENNGRRNENFSLHETTSIAGFPAYEDENGYILTSDIDHIEPMPWEDVDRHSEFRPNFAEYQYRVVR